MTRTLTPAICGLLLMLGLAGSAQAQRYRDQDRGGSRISFEIVRSREIVRRCDDLCGYRGYSRPGEGVYRIETRVYTEFRRGRVFRVWKEDVEVFMHCEERRGPQY